MISGCSFATSTHVIVKDFSKEQVHLYKENLKKISEMMNENKDKTKKLMDDLTENM